MTINTYKWSVSDWHQLVNLGVLDGKSVQLLNGEIVEMSPEGIPHSFTTRNVGDYLRDLFKGIAYISESHPITLDNSEPEPDIAIVRLPKTIYSQHHPYPEDIYFLIEVSKTTLQFDLEVKAKIYAQNNIFEYWIIDLVNKQLIVHTKPKGDRYQQIVKYKSGVISPEAFENVIVDLSRLIVV